MRPQPISRFPANRLFQIISKHFRNFSFTRLLRFLCHQLKLSYTIPSAGFCQITIEHREVHHFRNALRTIQKGGFLPKKVVQYFSFPLGHWSVIRPTTIFLPSRFNLIISRAVECFGTLYPPKRERMRWNNSFKYLSFRGL